MNPSNINKTYIGLTGGIASGKSAAAGFLCSCGETVLDADEIVRTLYGPGEACASDIRSEFGDSAVLPDGSVNRAGLARIVFESEEKRKILNGIVHPHVINRMFQLAEKENALKPESLIVFDVPLLIESGMYSSMFRNIVVTADDGIRLRRIMERDGLSCSEAEKRMNSQIPQDKQVEIADYHIVNNGSLQELFEKMAEVRESLRKVVFDQ